MAQTRVEVVDETGASVASAEGEVGDTMLDLCDEARAGVPFGCRNASCGTCVVELLSGAELLGPASRLELSVLAHHGVAPSDRLACRAIVGAAGLVRVRPRRTG